MGKNDRNENLDILDILESLSDDDLESMSNNKILTINKNVEHILEIGIGPVGWYVSDELKAMILEECRDHLGGDFSDEFDPFINDAIEQIESCVGPEYYDDDDDEDEDD